MCEVSTIMMVGAIASGVGTVINVMGAMDQSQANQDAANYQAQVSAQNAQLQRQNAETSRQLAEYNAAVTRNNAEYARRQAEDAISKGEDTVQDQRRKVAALKGTQVSTMAAHGLSLSEGTPFQILEETDLFGMLDEMTIRENAQKVSWAKRMEAYNFDAQAKGIDLSGNADFTSKMRQADMYSSESSMLSSKASSINPLMAGAGALFSGAGAVADKWYQWSKSTKNTSDWYNDSV
jgi:hypothetical protein